MFLIFSPLPSRFAGRYSNSNSNSVEFCEIYNFEGILRQFYLSAMFRVLSVEGLQNLSDKTRQSFTVALLSSFGVYLYLLTITLG